jgi:hypothetical protein
MGVLAADFNIGDPRTQAGELKLTGAIRIRYIYKDYIVEANEGSENGDWRILKRYSIMKTQTGLHRWMCVATSMTA